MAVAPPAKKAPAVFAPTCTKRTGVRPRRGERDRQPQLPSEEPAEPIRRLVAALDRRLDAEPVRAGQAVRLQSPRVSREASVHPPIHDLAAG